MAKQYYFIHSRYTHTVAMTDHGEVASDAARFRISPVLSEEKRVR